jgi:hypothetical protein
MHIALAVGCGLRLRKTRQSAVVDAAEFAVDVGGRHVEIRERGGGAWIFASPV